MSGEEKSGGPEVTGPEEGGEREVVYCIVPAGLAAKLHDPLREHFAEDRGVEVIVEHRSAERRAGEDRRAATDPEPPGDDERRAAAGSGDRRVGERRAPLMVVEAGDLPELPRRARRFAGKLAFVRRHVPRTKHAEDVDTARLVARHQAGDPRAFDVLYTRYFDRLFGYLKIVLKDIHEAEDLTQEVFAKTFKALPEYEPRGVPFRNWLFTNARNSAIQHLRKQGRIQVMDPAELAEQQEQQGEAVPEIDVPLDALDWIVDRDLLFLLERLPDPQRQVLALRYMLGLTTQEIANQLKLSPNNVAVLHYRALNFLRERLTALGRAPVSDTTNREPMRAWPKPARVLRNRRFSL